PVGYNVPDSNCITLELLERFMKTCISGCAVALIVSLALWAAPAQAAKQRQLWITNAYGNDVHIFDVDTLQLIRRVEVGQNPHGISATADGKTVHIALENFSGKNGEVLWIDTHDCQIKHRVAVGPL